MIDAVQLSALQTTRQLRCDQAELAERNSHRRLTDLLAGQAALVSEQQMFDRQSMALAVAVNARVIAGVAPVQAIDWLHTERLVQRAGLADRLAGLDRSIAVARSDLSTARQARRTAQVRLEKIKSVASELAREETRREERLAGMAQDELNAEHVATNRQFAARRKQEAHV